MCREAYAAGEWRRGRGRRDQLHQVDVITAQVRGRLIRLAQTDASRQPCVEIGRTGVDAGSLAVEPYVSGEIPRRGAVP